MQSTAQDNRAFLPDFLFLYGNSISIPPKENERSMMAYYALIIVEKLLLVEREKKGSIS
jgi:hypothetical protein